MRLPILPLLLLNLLLVGFGCEKNVREVRRDRPDIVAPGSGADTASAAIPVAPAGEAVAPSGEAVAPSGKPVTPSGEPSGISRRAATPADP